MIILFIRYLRGFIDVKFSGVRSEQILTCLNKEKILVWKLRYKSGTIVCKMLAKDYKRIRGIRRGTGVKVGIIARHGLPFFIKKYRRRAGFIAGAVIFFAILEFLSSFVWIINISGNNTVKSTEILKTLNEIGIYENMEKGAIDAKNNAQALLLIRDDLAWASLNLEGCVLNVNVSEIEKRIDNEKYEPTNLIASADGIVKKIDAVSGNVLVKVGESVHKGDILVSGIIESLSSTVFVESNAVITAQVERVYTASISFVSEVKKTTGQTQNRRIIEFLGIRIPLFLAGGEHSADITYGKEYLRILNKRIPVSIYTEVRENYILEKSIITLDEAESILSKRLADFIDGEEIPGYIPISTEYVSDESGVTVFHRYLNDENIAISNKMLVTQ